MRYIFLLLTCVPLPILAAELMLSSPREPAFGETFELAVSLDTEGERINATEGALLYPTDVLRLREIRDGNSVVNLWVEKPHDEGGRIIFAGITPGGYIGAGGELFSLFFDVLREGEVHFSLQDALAYENDGEGTAKPLSLADVITFSDRPRFTDDNIAPQAFLSQRTSDPSVFDGRTFVVFVAQDKESGIDHYEIAEGTGFRRYSIFLSTLHWETAESPYELRDQSGSAYVYVKAVDKEGNERIEILSPVQPWPLYNPFLSIGILLVILALLGLYAIRKKSVM